MSVESHFIVPRKSSEGSDLKRSLQHLTPTTEILKTAEELQFQEAAEIPDKGWTIYQRKDLSIPNFPEGETILDSFLAKLDYGEDPTGEQAHLLLFQSVRSSEMTEFTDSLATLERFFLKAPKVWGYPSRLIPDKAWILPAMLGAAIGAKLDIDPTVGSLWAQLVVGGMWGGITGAAVSFPATILAYNRLWKKIPHTSEYEAGSDIQREFNREKNHTIEVTFKRRLLEIWQAGVQDLSMDRFARAYSIIPPGTKRIALQEITDSLYQDPTTPTPHLEKLAYALRPAVEAGIY